MARIENSLAGYDLYLAHATYTELLTSDSLSVYSCKSTVTDNRGFISFGVTTVPDVWILEISMSEYVAAVLPSVNNMNRSYFIRLIDSLTKKYELFFVGSHVHSDDKSTLTLCRCNSTRAMSQIISSSRPLPPSDRPPLVTKMVKYSTPRYNIPVVDVVPGHAIALPDLFTVDPRASLLTYALRLSRLKKSTNITKNCLRGC